MANTGRLNVLWILCDQQPWNALNCYGNDAVRTPNIDRLALQGCRFTRCYVQHLLIAQCAASLLAGRYPVKTGSLQGGVRRVLQDNGYRCGAFDGENASATQQSLQFIAQGDGKPFSCSLRLRAHADPPSPPQRYLDLYDSRKLVPFHPPVLSRGEPVERQQAITHAYYASVSEVDACCGELLQELERNRLSESTLILYAGVCGLQVEPANIGKSGEAIPEAAVRVPLIVRGPADAIPGGALCDSIIEQIDVGPTVLELLGLSVPREMQGRSFRKLLTGESKEHRDSALTELPDRIALHTEQFQYSVRQDGRELLYDLADPAGHTRNVSGEMRYRGTLIEQRHRMITRLINANYAANDE